MTYKSRSPRQSRKKVVLSHESKVNNLVNHASLSKILVFQQLRRRYLSQHPFIRTLQKSLNALKNEKLVY